MDWGSQTGAVSRRQLEPWRREAGLKGRGARRENRVGLLWTPGEKWRGVLMGFCRHIACALQVLPPRRVPGGEGVSIQSRPVEHYG